HAGGYERREWWSPEGWSWRTHHGVVAPGHWERSADGRWYRRALCGPTLAGGARPVAHVSWYEADAYARSQGARLPTEAEWERAASDARDKRRYPWGPSFEVGRADLGRCSGDCAALGAHPRGASPSGIEDLCGGVWEWVADHFAPYPGFVPGRYAEYSAPWFGARHRVARGGSWLTAPSNARVTFRNWYEPHVRQPCLGVRLVRDACPGGYGAAGGSPMQSGPQVHLVDGTYELFRAFDGAPARQAPDGREVGAALGVASSLLRLVEVDGATPVGIAFDTVIESFR